MVYICHTPNAARQTCILKFFPMSTYDFSTRDRHWQKRWLETKIYAPTGKAEKSYILDMFPYPSGQGLHVGHPSGYIATDIQARFVRMQGKDVLHPMGWDAFGLPAENYAIKTGVHPRITTEKNIENYTRQLQAIGFSFDWDREISTTDPEYYKWTQWIFLKLYNRGLAYESSLPINWCPSCKTGLANEEVVKGGFCDRCGTKVEQKPIRQWVLKITEYADRLLEDLDGLDWPESIMEMQRNWIGRSMGATFRMKTAGGDDAISVFTTRLDTVFGMTFVAIAPEHPLVKKLTTEVHAAAVETYVAKAAEKSAMERTELAKEKTGVPTGAFVINPFNGDEVPVYVCDYVLGFYGTGAVMGVPAHDDRDFLFAETHGLDIRNVVTAKDGALHPENGAFTDYGILTDSGDFSGLRSEEAKEKMTDWLQDKGLGEQTVNYKLRDWIFSRQRYWGEPIPLVHCKKDGIVAVPEEQLPVLLPDVEKYEPSGTGESPLATIPEWVNTTCPTCGGPAKRETNTMPQWAGSCWYYLRFIDPKNDKAIADPELLKKWLPIDMYVGGAEHAVLHLLYSRFWHKVLYDEGVVPTKEPFHALRNQTMIQGEDGQKMSKSRGNVVNPDSVLEQYGADTFRTYEMFMGPMGSTIPWSTSSIEGVYRFLGRVWRLQEMTYDDAATPDELRILHKTIRKVTEDMAAMGYNTSIAQMMVCTNTFYELGKIARSTLQTFILLLAPFAPHMTEEIWEALGNKETIHLASWPDFDEALAKDDTVKVAIQVNGKLRGTIEVPADITEADAFTKAEAEPTVAKFLAEGTLRKKIYVPGKIINFVVA